MAKKRSGKKPPPKCKAILLCDQVIIDAITQKNSLIGIFEAFFVPNFPGMTSAFTVFLQFVDGIGRYELILEIHDLQQNSIIARIGPFPIEFPERVNKANYVFNILPFALPHSGIYDLVVLANGQEVDRQKFEARQPPIPGGAQHDPNQS